MNTKYQVKEFENQIEQKNVVQYDPLEHENSQKIHQPNTKTYLSKTSTHFRIKRNQNPQWPKEQHPPVKQREQDITRVQTNQEKYRNAPLKTIQYKTLGSQFEKADQEYIKNQKNQNNNIYPISRTNQNFYNNFFTPEQTMNQKFRAATTTNNFRKRNKIQSLMQCHTDDNSELENMIGASLSVKNLKSYCSELVDHPKLFYSISGLGFKNYKYPRPPVLKDRMEKYTQKLDKANANKQRKNIKNPIKNQLSSIEDICISKFVPTKFGDIRYGHIDPPKPRIQSPGRAEIQHRIEQQQMKERVVGNLQDLNEQVKQKNQPKVPKVREKKCQKFDNDTRFYTLRRDLQKSIEMTDNIFAKPENSHKTHKTTRGAGNYFKRRNPDNTRNPDINQNQNTSDQQLDTQLNELQQSQEIDIDITKQNLYPRVPGSKAKKINDCIDTYNKLVKYCNSILSAQYNNLSLIQSQQTQLHHKIALHQKKIMENQEELVNLPKQQDLNEDEQNEKQQIILKQLQDDQQFINQYEQELIEIQESIIPSTLSIKNRMENVLLLGVFQDNYSVLKENRKALSQRILLTLDLNPNDYYYPVSLDIFMQFCTVLIHRTASLRDIARFVQKFFLLEESKIMVSDFKSLLRTLTMTIDQKHKNVQKSLYLYLLEHFVQNEVIAQKYDDSTFIDVDKFYRSLLLNKENTLDLLDLICGMN